jgi:hypothetical protein
LDHRGTNLPAVGEYNQTFVLDAIRRRSEGIIRSEIAGRTALSVMTATKVCRRLLDAGLVDEQGMRSGGPGKPAVVVKLNPSGGFAVGVHIDPAAVTYVLVDRSCVPGIGIASPGPVSVADGVLLNPPMLAELARGGVAPLARRGDRACPCCWRRTRRPRWSPSCGSRVPAAAATSRSCTTAPVWAPACR